MRAARFAGVAVLLLALAGCTGRLSPAEGVRCPTVGQAMDRYLRQLKNHTLNAGLSFAGCTPDQVQQRLTDMQLILDHGTGTP